MKDGQTNAPANFQQLNLLRKALTQKKTGVLSYISESGHHGRIDISLGNINDDNQSKQELLILFSEPVKHCEWMICPLKENNWIEPILAVSRVINIIQWDNTSILRLKKLFTKLPPVRVRMIPLHRFEYNVGHLPNSVPAIHKKLKFFIARFFKRIC